MMQRLLATCWRLGVFLILAAAPWLSGCGGGGDDAVELPLAEETSAAPAAPLHVLVVDDRPLAKVIQRHWQAQSRQGVQIDHVSAADCLKRLASTDLDVVIYPAGLLGELVERELIAPVPERVLDLEAYDRPDVLPFERGPVISWGKTIYAFSFGSPCLNLMYRADIFKHLNLSPPRTWDEYQQLAARLADRSQLGELAPSDQLPWSATAEPLAPGWAGQLLLARAAAYARSHSRFSTLFNYKTMEPLIDREPFVRALTELVAAAAHGPKEARTMGPAEARAALLEGRCAMALSWPARTAQVSGSTKAVDVGFALLPGSRQVYNFTEERWEQRRSGDSPVVPLLAVSGRLGSVLKRSGQSSAAFSMLATLTGPQLGQQVAPHSAHTTMFRSSQLPRAADWIGQPIAPQAALIYAEVLRAEHARTLWVFSPRIPGRAEYLAALDEAVQQALDGRPAAEALGRAADKWAQITRRLGKKSQQDAYARSFGLEL